MKREDPHFHLHRMYASAMTKAKNSTDTNKKHAFILIARAFRKKFLEVSDVKRKDRGQGGPYGR